VRGWLLPGRYAAMEDTGGGKNWDTTNRPPSRRIGRRWLAGFAYNGSRAGVGSALRPGASEPVHSFGHGLDARSVAVFIDPLRLRRFLRSTALPRRLESVELRTFSSIRSLAVSKWGSGPPFVTLWRDC
jgi:hypothetical protein